MSRLVGSFFEDLYRNKKLKMKLIIISTFGLPIIGMAVSLVGVSERIVPLLILTVLVPFEFGLYLWLKPKDISEILKRVERNDPAISEQLVCSLREYSEGEEPIVPLLPPTSKGTIDRSKLLALPCFRNT